jgi:tetratricopeptide (TPR) repeat protein
MPGGTLARKHKRQQQTLNLPGDLRRRSQRARAEGRTQNALELSKQLYKSEPTPENLRELREVYLERSRQLRSHGQSRDAVIVLEAALNLENPPPEWLAQAAIAFAQAGAVQKALELAERLPDTSCGSQIRGFVADAAVENPSLVRPSLSPTLQAELDAVLQAFRQTETAEEEAARTTLQGIGLRSPFLEWKLLIRGLQAYYQNDDARADENWQRLDLARLPARLAAPFRSAIDPDFRAAQPAETQATLQRQLRAFETTSIAGRLRSLQSSLENKHSLAQAFRQAEALVPQLRQEAPGLIPRLASCLYWAALETGPDDLPRYQRVFGQPTDDPYFHRLRAMANEKCGQLQAAQVAWEQFEKDLAANPNAWPNGVGNRARALVWLRMGKNAVAAEQVRADRMFMLSPFSVAEVVKPSADHCFRRSRELAPNLLEAYEALFDYHYGHEHPAKAERAARDLLQRFPDHADTLERLSTLRKQHGDSGEALRLLQQALHANPLSRDVRAKLADAHLDHARALTLRSQFDEARRELESAGALQLDFPWTLPCVRAAVEFKAKNPAAAEEALLQAAQTGTKPVVAAHAMLVEVARLKLPPAVKTRFQREFKAGLAAPPDPQAAIALLRYSLALADRGESYVGAKTHAKNIADYAKAAVPASDADMLAQMVALLVDRLDFRQAISLAQKGQNRFPQDPFFPFFEAIALLRDEGRPLQTWRVDALLRAADSLAQAQPSDERMRHLLDRIAQERRQLEAQDPFGSTFQRLMDMNSFDDGDDDEFDYDE